MISVFISHSSKDALFQNRLVEVLNKHGVKTWSSAHDLQGGDDYKEEINAELSRTDVIIIIVSKNSKKSNWVSREITYFQAKKPEGKVIPIRLDETDANRIYDGLGNFHVIDFFMDHISGYKNVLAVFEKEFVFNDKHQEKRKDNRRNDERRENERRNDERRDDERRDEKNRRAFDSKAIARRLRVGYLNCYLRETRNSEFHEIDLNRITEMLRFIKDLKDEAKKFTYIDENQVKIDPVEALELATNKVWNEMREFKSNIKVAYLIDAIVGELIDQYNVESVDRREEDRREEERREQSRRDNERRDNERRN